MLARPRAKTYVAALLLGGGLGLPSLSTARPGCPASAAHRLTKELCLPSVKTASSSGGAGLAPPSAPAPGSADVRPGDATVMVRGHGITVTTRESAQLRQPLRFAGRVPAIAAGHAVEIERRSAQAGGTWAPTAQGVVGANGSFSVIWRTDQTGRFAIRAVIGGPSDARTASSARADAASPTLAVTIYSPATATFYGPGFYGQRTACGGVLRPVTLGVANRALKCGTPVAIYYRGRTIVVPVIDRGPYANGADWDLTAATATALGISGTVTIGAVSLR